MQPWLILLLALPFFSTDAHAGTLTTPLPTKQMNPAMLRYLDPAPESASIKFTSNHTLSIRQHYSSIMLADSLPIPNRFVADMELYTVEFQYSFLIAADLETSIIMPIMLPYKGLLDPSIRQFHNSFGMPDNGRHLRPDNIYAYQFSAVAGGWNSTSRIEPGNLNLNLKYQWMDEDTTSVALLVAAKLPTANRSRGWGNGSSDIAIGAAASWQSGSLFSHMNFWWIHPFNRTDFGHPVRDYFRSSLTAGWQPKLLASWLEMPTAIAVQVQGGTSPYRTGVLPLDRSPWLISFGTNFKTDSGRNWSITFTENITQSSTQDFGLTVGVQIPLNE